MTSKIRCIGHISTYADPQRFHDWLAQLDDVAPNCPWNVDAAETLAKPVEQRGWQQTYVDAVSRLIEEK